MINRAWNVVLVSLFLLLSACGGGGGGDVGQIPGSDNQSLTSDTGSNTGTATQAGTLSLKWVAPAARSDGDALALSEIASYTIYFGTSEGDYPYSVAINSASTTNVDIPDLPVGTYYLVMTATDTQGLESGYSSVAVKEVT